jgi:proteic killer suppression protein
MIRSFKHRGLKALYDGKTARRLAPAHIEKLRDILAVLDHSRGPGEMNVPGFRLHPSREDSLVFGLYRSLGVGA